MITIKQHTSKLLDQNQIHLSRKVASSTSTSDKKEEFKTLHMDGKLNISITAKGYQSFLRKSKLEKDIETAIIDLQPTRL